MERKFIEYEVPGHEYCHVNFLNSASFALSPEQKKLIYLFHDYIPNISLARAITCNTEVVLCCGSRAINRGLNLLFLKRTAGNMTKKGSVLFSLKKGISSIE